MVLAALVALLAGLGWWMSGPASDSGVETTPATIGPVVRTIPASGRIKARTTVEVGSEVSGRILEVNAIAQGDYLAIAGASGSGKSTLVNLLGCLDRIRSAFSSSASMPRSRWT